MLEKILEQYKNKSYAHAWNAEFSISKYQKILGGIEEWDCLMKLEIENTWAYVPAFFFGPDG